MSTASRLLGTGLSNYELRGDLKRSGSLIWNIAVSEPPPPLRLFSVPSRVRHAADFLYGMALSAQPRMSHCGRPAANQLRRRFRKALGIPGAVHCLGARCSRPGVSIAKDALGPSGLRLHKSYGAGGLFRPMVTSCLREDRKPGATARTFEVTVEVVGGFETTPKDYGPSASRVCEGARLTPAKWAGRWPAPGFVTVIKSRRIPLA
jgi:hypothetical protein